MMRNLAKAGMIVTLALCCTMAVRAGWAAPASSPGNCAAEAATLSKDESELPRLDVASPEDRPPYCITLETLMAFAGRLKTHVGRCPASNFAGSIAEWDKMRADYSKRFVQTKCKRTIFN